MTITNVVLSSTLTKEQFSVGRFKSVSSSGD